MKQSREIVFVCQPLSPLYISLSDDLIYLGQTLICNTFVTRYTYIGNNENKLHLSIFPNTRPPFYLQEYIQYSIFSMTVCLSYFHYAVCMTVLLACSIPFLPAFREPVCPSIFQNARPPISQYACFSFRLSLCMTVLPACSIFFLPAFRLPVCPSIFQNTRPTTFQYACVSFRH